MSTYFVSASRHEQHAASAISCSRAQFGLSGCEPWPSAAKLVRQPVDRVRRRAIVEPAQHRGGVSRTAAARASVRGTRRRRRARPRAPATRHSRAGRRARRRRRCRATRSRARAARRGRVDRARVGGRGGRPSSTRRRSRARRRRPTRAAVADEVEIVGNLQRRRSTSAASDGSTIDHDAFALRESVHRARTSPEDPSMSRDATTSFAAHAGRRVGAQRRHRRVPRTRIALGAARARAGRRRPDPAPRAPRRALGVVLRARCWRRRRAAPRSCCARRAPRPRTSTRPCSKRTTRVCR